MVTEERRSVWNVGIGPAFNSARSDPTVRSELGSIIRSAGPRGMWWPKGSPGTTMTYVRAAARGLGALAPLTEPLCIRPTSRPRSPETSCSALGTLSHVANRSAVTRPVPPTVPGLTVLRANVQPGCLVKRDAQVTRNEKGIGPRRDQTRNARVAFEQSFATPEEKSNYFRQLAFRSGYVRRQRRIDRLVAELDAERAKLRGSCVHRFGPAPAECDLCSYCGARFADVTA